MSHTAAILLPENFFEYDRATYAAAAVTPVLEAVSAWLSDMTVRSPWTMHKRQEAHASVNLCQNSLTLS